MKATTRVSPTAYLSAIESQLVLQGSKVVLKDTCLKECPCPNTGSHNRFLKNNTRTKMENILIDHIKTNFIDRPVNILSLGAGGLLQELLLVIKLVKAGIRDINLTMIEPTNNQEAYDDFQKQIELLKNNFPDLRIKYAKHESIDEVSKSGTKFNVVYAIDYDDYLSFKDYSNRQLEGRAGIFKERKNKTANDEEKLEDSNVIVFDESRMETENKPIDLTDEPNVLTPLLLDQPDLTLFQTSNRSAFQMSNRSARVARKTEPVDDEGDPYFASIDLIKAVGLLHDDETKAPLALVSQGKDILSLNSTTNHLTKFTEYPLLSRCLPNYEEISAFYIYANIAHLINNLSFFIEAKKPVVINESIIQEEDRPLVEQFLKNNGIQYEFMKEKNLEQLAKYQTNGLIAVVDYTIYDQKKNERTIPEELNKQNIFVARIDWVKSKRNNIHLAFFPSLEKAKRLVLKEPTNAEIEIAKELDKEIINSLTEGNDIESQKKQYLNLLKNKLDGLDANTKKLFAAYLLNTPDHLLKKERHFFRTQTYSVQTRSFHKALSILLGDSIEVISRKIFINDYELKRHVNAKIFNPTKVRKFNNI